MHHKSLDCLNAATGAVERSGSMTAAPSYAIVPVACTDDAVYCPLGGGIVQAFSRADLTSRWIYTDPLGGQALSPVTVDGNLLFTGFWNEENEDAAFVCLDANTGACLWRVVRTGGFYCTSCRIEGAYVLLGGDDGSVQTGTGELLCLDKATGKTLDSLAFSGDHRSGILSYAGAYYFATKAGVLYQFRMHAGELTLIHTAALPGAVTATPIGYGGNVYLGVQQGRAGAVLVLDAHSLQRVRLVSVQGYPQGEMLLVDADAPRLVLTCNTPPGGLTVVDPESGTAQALYTPETGAQGYCISPVSCTPDGTLLYKNDSGTVFAVGHKPQTPQKRTFIQRLLDRIRAFWKKVISLFTGGKR